MVEGPRRVELDAQAYDDRWARLAADGHDVHGEASLVERLVARPATILDAGCGTGRVAIRLADRGYTVVGIDVDPLLLAQARAKAPTLEWRHADLATMASDDAPGPFDAIVMAGNVMIFVAPATEAVVVRNLAARLAPAGSLIAGFQLSTGRATIDDYDAWTRDAGLVPAARYATWDGEPFTPDSNYVVAIDVRPRS
ncbi:MAG: class I SAM-dependent methyltransferase [Acidimicrobiia bacterium]